MELICVLIFRSYTGNGSPIRRQEKVVELSGAVPFSNPNIATVEKAIEAGRKKVACVAETQTCLLENNIRPRPGSSSSLLSFFNRDTSPDAKKITEGATFAFFAATELLKEIQQS